jgi:hypothetical protein
VVGSLARPAAAAAQSGCGGATLVAEVVAGIFGRDAAAADVNRDERLGAADLVAAAQFGDPPSCPQAPALLQLDVDNRSGARVLQVALRGTRLGCDCLAGDLATSFAQTFTCLGPEPRRCGHIGGLAPGEWLLEFRVDQPDLGQVQYRRALLVGADGPVVARWTAFAAVLVVDDPDNTGIGSLRNRIQLARTAPKPLLIRFDDEVFPAGEAVLVPITFPLTTLDSDDVTIDGIDARGLAGNRGVDAQEQPFGAFSVSGARNHLIGLRLRGAGGDDRDLLQVAGAAADGNRFEGLIIEGPASGDGIGVDDFGTRATVIRDCEIRGARDKGIKVTAGAHARIENSWIRGNANGGIQATLGGHVLVVDSVVEANAGVGGENGLAVQGLDEVDALSTLTAAGTLVRDNGGNGLSVRAYATAVVADSAFVGNGTGGMRVFNDVGAPALAAVEGSAFACNLLDGVVVTDDSAADLGGGAFASPGDNAFAYNGESGAGFDLRNISSNAVAAAFSQWDSCGRSVVCNESAVLATDVRDGGAGVSITPAVAPGGLGVPVVTRVEPERGRAGDLLRIFGSGFDAVNAYGGRACEAPAEANGCNPVRGNCVTIAGEAAEVVAATPTMLLVRRPFTCLEPVALQVSVAGVDRPATSGAVEVCGSAAGAAVE